MDEPILECADQAGWEAWLERHGAGAAGVWLRLAKKGVPRATPTYAQAVESALCHGWIDGRKQGESAQYWLQRFTPRTATSIWSQINKDKAEALIAAGRMRPAGLREVERARASGRWDAAYASASKATVPDDFRRALDASPAAAAGFAALDGQNRYAMLFRLHNVKRAETRARKIDLFIGMLERGEKIHP